MMTFDRLQAGSVLGQCDFEFSEATFGEWWALFPDDAASRPTMPSAMVAMVLMRAFMSIMSDRPPGNIHAGQKFRIVSLPVLGDRLSTQLRCLSKDIRNSRRWVTFGSETSDAAGRPLFFGEMTTLWAA